ncbi:MAG: Uncharacterized protein XD63_0132 [Thermoanaerobacterales bacterium 50_218]|nr:MAG: Uncharacterized protein XD63_0132 [Thermoanaerobacterales bacterium 50_218]HAA89492.1 DUF512 domain-containing protein [Peptococcaceae bacterium]
MVAIAGVRPRSIAEKLGVRAGDYLLTVNRIVPRDYIHYRYLIAEEKLKLRIRNSDGKTRFFSVEKAYDTDLGLIFSSDCFDGIRRCQNKCIFCFVDQLPKGLRPSLYEKDDDYRLSFLHGNFITLTNLRPQDITRIITFHLSPLYVSVHATDPSIRGQMLGKKHPQAVLEQLQTLVEGGITVHTQVVLCPGINDGPVLEKTIRDLSLLWPGVRSLGIVPVGLTKFRKNLPLLRSFTRPECVQLIRKVAGYRKGFRKKFGCSFVYLSDEFYLRAGIPFPPGLFYDGYPQLENGIGMARLFYDQFREFLPKLPSRLKRYRRFLVVTGYAGARVLAPVVARLNLIRNLDLKLVAVPNTFFGLRVNVTGLLTGKDLLWGLRGVEGEELLLPAVLLRKGTSMFLDGVTVGEIAARLKCKVRVIEPTASALVAEVTGTRIDEIGNYETKEG